jgi:hypothetical protein
MSIFGTIMSAIFGHAKAAAPGSAAGGAAAPPASAPMSNVDVEAVLTKLLNLDSGLGARKELAKELGYTGDMNDSASMNIWLHKQVMQKLAANGGKVPADLK